MRCDIMGMDVGEEKGRERGRGGLVLVGEMRRTICVSCLDGYGYGCIVLYYLP